MRIHLLAFYEVAKLRDNAPLNWVCFLEATFSSLFSSSKAPQKLSLEQVYQPQRPRRGNQIFGQVINRVGKIADFGHKSR